MRAAETYRAQRRNTYNWGELLLKDHPNRRRKFDRQFRRLSGSNHKLDFPVEKKDETSGLMVPFITVKSPRVKGKSYPYRSIKRGATGPVVTLSW